MPGMSPGVQTPTPAAAPSANLGAQAHASGQVKQALIMLETALPHLGIQSPLHKAAMQAITNLSKHLPASGGQGQDQALQQSMLRDLALRSQQMSPMLAAMQARSGQPGGAPGGPPGGPPPESPPSGGGMPGSPGA